MALPGERLKNALRYCSHGGDTSAILELVAQEGVTSLSIQRTMLPSLRLNQIVLGGIATMDLSKSRLGPHAFNCVMYAVARASSILTTLDVSSNFANNDCCAAVGHLVNSSRFLTNLKISNNPLTTSLAEHLGKALRANKSLRDLDASSTGLIDASALFQGLSGHGLEKLNVSNNSCGKSSWSKLSSSMSAGLKLKVLKASCIEMEDEGASVLAAGIRSSKSLIELILDAARLGNEGLSQIVDACTSCPDMVCLSLADNKASSRNHEPLTRSLGNISKLAALKELRLGGSEMSPLSADALFRSLPTSKFIQKLDVSGNSLPEESSILLKQALFKLFKEGRRLKSLCCGRNSIEKLFYADVMADDFEDEEGEPVWLPDELDAAGASLSAEVVEQMASLLGGDACPISSLTMEGVPLGKPPGQGRLPRGAAPLPPIISQLLAKVQTKAKRGQAEALVELHLHNCALKDVGATFVADLITAGAKLRVLDLGLNEIGDAGTSALAQAITADGNRVQELQMRLNRCRNDGATALAGALPDPGCSLKFLGLTSNLIGTAGLRAIMEVVGASDVSVEVVQLDTQTEAVWREEDFEAGARRLHARTTATEIVLVGFGDLSGSLKTANTEPHLEGRLESKALRSLKSVDLTSEVKEQVNLAGIEGMANAGRVVDCGAVLTDHAEKSQLSTPSLQDCFDLANALLGEHQLSPAEFEGMMGGFGTTPGSSPSWLAVPELRARGLYVAHLQLSVTKDRLEDFFESEADANVQEIVFCVDKALKNPNGFAFVLFKDEESVAKALSLYREGRASIYGGPFILSALSPTLAASSSEDTGSAQADIERRAAEQSSRKAGEKANVDAMHANAIEKQQNQKAAYGGSDMGMSQSNALGGAK